MILSVPGDKSITQRALILGGLAAGRSRLRGLLASADPRSTAAALRRLGVGIPAISDEGDEIVVDGRGLRGLTAPVEPLDLANSGTGARLLLGVLAGQAFPATVTGDASLRGRPMRRVTDPLEAMGARFEDQGEPGRLPVRVHGGALRPLEYALPVASAQVKSALLLAGLVGRAFVLLTEPGRSRDHTERMLTAVGAAVIVHDRGPGRRVELRDPPEAIRPLDLTVPGDFSSAAFPVVAALLGGVEEALVVEGVGLNPTRTGLLPVLRRMGGRIEVLDERAGSGEPTGTLVVRPSSLKGVEVGIDEIPTCIDEIPALAVAAARAEGTTRITGAGELRLKETDRLRALALGLRALGVTVEELDDGLEIEGTDAPLRGRVRAWDDHRIAMAFGALGASPAAEVTVDDPASVRVSYPGFWEDLARLEGGRGPGSPRGGARSRSGGAAGSERADGDPDGHEPAGSTVVTIDGPAGSGKSTTARAVAARLGWRYLDSGALYRALTWALLDRGTPPERWASLEPADLKALGVEVELAPEGVVVLHRGRPLADELRTDEVTAHVSQLAALPAVRSWLLDTQRAVGARGRLVADGRDMGTVVFPDARTKIFLSAEPRERARRRLRDKGDASPDEARVEEETERLRERDRRDSEREHSPLRRAPDSVVIDTTRLDFDAQVERIVREVRRRAGGPASKTG
ncbi:MAG: 3-phosphoshikimate 1-carboxyvinyltransferase [Gemmatimonadota bacterium]|jgi:3-phosphoshikimate 1-carboxyvinyltransferase